MYSKILEEYTPKEVLDIIAKDDYKFDKIISQIGVDETLNKFLPILDPNIKLDCKLVTTILDYTASHDHRSYSRDANIVTRNLIKYSKKWPKLLDFKIEGIYLNYLLDNGHIDLFNANFNYDISQ